MPSHEVPDCPHPGAEPRTRRTQAGRLRLPPPPGPRLHSPGTGPVRRQNHPVRDAWWAQARKVHGERDGTRVLIEVLLLNRHIAHEHMVAGLALEARKATQSEGEPALSTSAPQMPGETSATVTSLHEWRLAHLPPDTRPLPSVNHYDQLLRPRRTSGGGHHEGGAQCPCPASEA